MAVQERLVFINLPVADLQAARTFFGELGFGFDERFADDSCACMVISDKAYVMLIVEARFADFTAKPIADAHAVTEAIVCVSADSRAGVDAFADTALAHGGGTAREPMDYGFMYGRSFHDLDGHLWEVTWMDPKAVEQGPAGMAESLA